MSNPKLTFALTAATCLFASQVLAATCSVNASAEGRFELNLGYLEGEVPVFYDPIDDITYYDTVFLAGYEAVTVNGVLGSEDTVSETKNATAQTSSEPTALPATASTTLTYVVTNTHATLTVQAMSFDFAM